MRGARAGGGSGGGGPEEAVPFPRIAPSRPAAVTDGPRRVLTSRCVSALGGSPRDARLRPAGHYPDRRQPGLWKLLLALARPGLRERRGGGVVLSRPEEPAAFPAFRKTPLGARAGECSCQQLRCKQSAAIQSGLDVSVPENRSGFQSLKKVFVEWSLIQIVNMIMTQLILGGFFIQQLSKITFVNQTESCALRCIFHSRLFFFQFMNKKEHISVSHHKLGVESVKGSCS